MQQLGFNLGELVIPPPTLANPYPPLPLELDDMYIYEHNVSSQPPGIISTLTGFNLNCQVYMNVTPISTMELAYGIDNVFDWNKQKKVLEQCLRAVKQVLEHAPPELMLQPGSQPGEFDRSGSQYYPPMISIADYPGVRSNGHQFQWPQGSGEARRQLQYEIQKANIYASQLGTRSYIVEKYWSLHQASLKLNVNEASNIPGALAVGLDGMLSNNSTSTCDGVETNVANERENIIKDLLRVLSSISQVNMEPNGTSFVGCFD